MDELNQDLPEAGETILCCEHAGDPQDKPFHFFDNPLDDPDDKPQIITVVNQSNGREFRIRWVILCDDCAEERKGPEGTNPFAGPLQRAVWAPGDMNTKVQ